MARAAYDANETEDKGVEPAAAALEALLVADEDGDEDGGDVEDELDYGQGISIVPHGGCSDSKFSKQGCASVPAKKIPVGRRR